MKKRLLYTVILLLITSVAFVVYAVEPYNIMNVRRSFDPSPAITGDPATVSLAVSGDQCVVSTNVGASVMLVLDRSGSMDWDNPSRITSAVQASKLFVQRMRIEANDQVGVASFGEFGRVDAPLGSSRNVVNAALDDLLDEADGGTSIGTGIRAANRQLGSANAVNSKAIVVLSDGVNDPSSGVGLMLREAEAACNAGYSLFTVGVAENPDAVDPELADIACGGGFYREVSAPIDQDILNAIYGEIVDQVLGPIATDVSITDQVPAGLSVSNISDGGYMNGNVVTWQLSELVNNKTVTYRVNGAPGTYTFNSGTTSSTQCDGGNASMPVQNGTLRIVERPTNVPPANNPPTNAPPTAIPPTPLPSGPWPTAIPTATPLPSGPWPTNTPTYSPPTAVPPTDIPPTATDAPPTDVPPTAGPPQPTNTPIMDMLVP